MRIPLNLIDPGQYFEFDGRRFLKSDNEQRPVLSLGNGHPVSVEVGTGRMITFRYDKLVVPVAEGDDLGQGVELRGVPDGTLFRLDGRLRRRIRAGREPGTVWVVGLDTHGIMMGDTVVHPVPLY